MCVYKSFLEGEKEMSLILPKTCSMGSNKTGLVGTIGVTLLSSNGSTHAARTTTGIYEIGGGCYAKQITFDDDWIGSIKWDTGGGSPLYAIEEYSYYENNPKVDNIKTQIDKMNFIDTDIKATLDSEEVDIGKVKGTNVSSINDFKATGFATSGDLKVSVSTPASVYQTISPRWSEKEKNSLIKKINKIESELQKLDTKELETHILKFKKSLLELLKFVNTKIFESIKEIKKSDIKEKGIHLKALASIKNEVDILNSRINKMNSKEEINEINLKIENIFKVLSKTLSNEELEKVINEF